MFNINRVTLLGNVTHDPDARATKTGQTVANIGFATNRRVKNDKGEYESEPEYHKLVCFGSLADFCTTSVAKGAPLYVEGRLHTSKYKNKEGKQASRTDIVVDQLVLLSPKKNTAVAAA